ncbi:MAG: hypothetical protein ABR583_11995 [Gaiellaceae bacterium]
MSPRFLPVGKESKGAAGFLLAAIPALGAVLTALAITGDTIGRMARNHPLASIGAFGLAALAVFLGALAAFALRQGSRAERVVLRAGLVALGTALVAGVYGGVETWGDRAQPSITLRPKPRSTVAVSVTGSGLRSRDHIVVEVEQLTRVVGEDGRVSWKPGQPLYGASLGPDGGGDIDHTVDLALPPGDYDDIGARAWVGDEPAPCYTRGNTTGCVRVHISRPQERPQLAVSWETFVRAPRLLIRLKARNLPQRPARSMALRVYGSAAGRPRRSLAEWSLAPDAEGVFERRLAVVVGRTFSDVCVVASIVTRDPGCPGPIDDGTVWAQLAVPSA